MSTAQAKLYVTQLSMTEDLSSTVALKGVIIPLSWDTRDLTRLGRTLLPTRSICFTSRANSDTTMP
jgi:hypothetical protein